MPREGGLAHYEFIDDEKGDEPDPDIVGGQAR